ncbi:dipeptidase [Ktedonospora formicarum]|uniref:Peptidase n=1 Tax=Ktedonospora formicarum TaxID=2778364 RepID=A0A8J3HUH5_9CHLR|nr:membrane dipeptidase [Ktedonospora formicarum]GHO43994.1 peptidase [Ktedonospora formicarum]
MLIIDAHQDIAYNALEWDRDIRRSVYETRKREEGYTGHPAAHPTLGAGGIAMSGLPELRRGGFSLVFATIFCEPLSEVHIPACTQPLTQAYTTAEEAYRIGQAQFAYYQELANEPGVSLVLNQQDLHSHLTSWQVSSPDDPQRPFGIVPLMEGADPIRTPEEAEAWYEQGLRIVGLAWHGTRYSGGTSQPGPLTSAGRDLLKVMERVGLILDMSHSAEESFWQALDLYSGPVMASHSNCRVYTPTDRHLTDDMIRALIERDAVIGMVPGNFFLNGEWKRNHRFPVHLEQVVRHIDHVCQISGDALHVGLGSDIDGGFGRDETPEELDTALDFVKIADILKTSGYKEDDIFNIMGGNWKRFLSRALPAS